MDKRYGRLTMVEEGGNTALFSCACGTIKYINKYRVFSMKTRSCGCLRRETTASKNRTHGQSGSPAHTSWKTMMVRCYNKNNPKYKNYGGRGISVCRPWHKFENFIQDMGERPAGKTLDRKSVNGNYTPRNCRWATIRQQSLNKTTSCILKAKGKKQTLKEWAEETGVHRSTIYRRLKRGLSVEKAVTGVAR